MLAAYYSKGADFRAVFEKMKVARTPKDKFFLETPPFERYLNRCNVIYWDMTDFVTGGDINETVSRIQKDLVAELKHEFPQVRANDARTLQEMICAVTVATGERFYIIIDEWDMLFREARDNEPLQKKYIDFLRGLFKGTRTAGCLCGAYMTGILPIKKYGTSSALTDFNEFSMLNPGELAEYVGFTSDEVKQLCR